MGACTTENVWSSCLEFSERNESTKARKSHRSLGSGICQHGFSNMATRRER